MTPDDQFVALYFFNIAGRRVLMNSYCYTYFDSEMHKTKQKTTKFWFKLRSGAGHKPKRTASHILRFVNSQIETTFRRLLNYSFYWRILLVKYLNRH